MLAHLVHVPFHTGVRNVQARSDQRRAGPGRTVAHGFQPFLSMQRSPGSFADPRLGPSRQLAPSDFALERSDLGPTREPWMCFHDVCLVRISQAVEPVQKGSPSRPRRGPAGVTSRIDKLRFHRSRTWREGEPVSTPDAVYSSFRCCVGVPASPGQRGSWRRRGWGAVGNACRRKVAAREEDTGSYKK